MTWPCPTRLRGRRGSLEYPRCHWCCPRRAGSVGCMRCWDLWDQGAGGVCDLPKLPTSRVIGRQAALHWGHGETELCEWRTRRGRRESLGVPDVTTATHDVPAAPEACEGGISGIGDPAWCATKAPARACRPGSRVRPRRSRFLAAGPRLPAISSDSEPAGSQCGLRRPRTRSDAPRSGGGTMHRQGRT